MALTTDWRVKLLDGLYDVTDKCEWGVNIQETLGQAATATFVLQDRFMGDYDFQDLAGGGFDLEEIDVVAGLDGVEVPMFRGKLLHPEVELPNQFPWRRQQMQCTDYQREVFDRREVGVPDGSLWEGPDSDGNYVAVDPNALFDGGTDKLAVQRLFTVYASIPPAAIDADTFVNEYTTLTGAPYLANKATVRQVMDWLAGLVSGNLQYWMDPALRVHWQVIPRWFEQASIGEPLPRMLPSTEFPMEAAPVDIDNDNPDGITSVACRNLGWGFDYGNILHQLFVNGGTGYAYNGGVVDRGGTGWVSFGLDNLPSISRAQGIIDVPESIDLPSRMAAAARADKATTRGVLRGHLTVGGVRHHPDGFHVGQAIKITDARMPIYLRGRYFPIQRVTTTLIPNVNWRVYDIEWGDAPIARSSTRRPLARDEKVQEPGRLWGISGNNQQLLPGSTSTQVGQLLNDHKEPRRVYGVSVRLELHVWDADGNPVTGVGSISPDTVTTDSMGQWSTQMTVGSQPGYYYCVDPVGSGSCHLP